MTDQTYHVLGIGNAIVDVLKHETDDFLYEHDIEKGAMTLIDAERAEWLYARMAPATEVSGGSAANSMAGLASLGCRGAYIGKVKDDPLGRVFRTDIETTGIVFRTPAETQGAPTARCLIVVTPDAQRSMSTYLGASTDLGPEDVDGKLVASAAVTYLEGYLWDKPRAKNAFLKAADVAHQAGHRVSLSLSDSFCVDRHRVEFLDLVRDHVDVLFANEAEITSLYQTDGLDQAVAQVRGQCEIAVVTRSEKGSLVVTHDAIHEVAAEPVTHVTDTTGAGDLYAAGFLVGLTAGQDLPVCGRLGAIAAAEVISHLGARPVASLASLARAKGIAL